MDQIELTLSAENRSRRQIGNKLKELGLISKMEEVTRKPLKSSREWQRLTHTETHSYSLLLRRTHA